jgi:hypothetical protein
MIDTVDNPLIVVDTLISCLQMLTNSFAGFLSNGSICDLKRVYLWQVWILAQLVEIFSNDGALSQKAEGLLVQSVPIPVGCALAHLHMHSISNHQLQAKSIVKQDAQIQLHGISLQDPQSEESYSE